MPDGPVVRVEIAGPPARPRIVLHPWNGDESRAHNPGARGFIAADHRCSRFSRDGVRKRDCIKGEVPTWTVRKHYKKGSKTNLSLVCSETGVLRELRKRYLWLESSVSKTMRKRGKSSRSADMAWLFASCPREIADSLLNNEGLVRVLQNK